MESSMPIFRNWVPAWLVKFILFIILVPNIVLFFLPLSNINVAAGYYGCEPADIQFSVALFFAGFAAFFSLEQRFFAYLPLKGYYILFIFLLIVSNCILYNSKELYIFLPIRFLQGMLLPSVIHVTFTLMFTQMHKSRSREMSFSILYCLLLCAMPLNNFITADLIDNYNFNMVYKVASFSYLPCLILLITSMNNVRIGGKIPLYQLDWPSFAFLSVALSVSAFILIYGQEFYWFQDRRLRTAIIAVMISLILFSLRQLSRKRPYIYIDVLKNKKFLITLLALLVFDVFRFSLGITNTYFSSVLLFDPYHLSFINLFNISGILAATVISCFLIISKMPFRPIWITGLIMLLVFHIRMYFLFDVAANEGYFIFPLILQGLGTGFLITPTVLYALSSVAPKKVFSAIVLTLVVRFFGFCLNIGLVNYVELLRKSKHFNSFQDGISQTNQLAIEHLKKQAGALYSKGLLHSQTVKGADKLLIGSINKQAQLRFGMDYYELMIIIISTLLIGMFLIPHVFKWMRIQKAASHIA